jgi:hypothetical protein
LTNNIINAVTKISDVPTWVKNFISDQYMYDPTMSSLSKDEKALIAATNYPNNMCKPGEDPFYFSQVAVRGAGVRPEDVLAYAKDHATDLNARSSPWERFSGYADVHKDSTNSKRTNGMMTVYSSGYRWETPAEMEEDEIMQELIKRVWDKEHDQYNSRAFLEIRESVVNLRKMYDRKAKGTYKACRRPCPGNDLIAHDPHNGGCARMQTQHEEWLIVATNKTTNFHCNVYPDNASDNRRGEVDMEMNPLLAYTGTRLVTYSQTATDKGPGLARAVEERMKEKVARQGEEQDGEEGNDFVWNLLRNLLKVRARWMGREASYSGANPPDE